MNAQAAARLLVVDDEPDLRTLYELTLVREGYHVDVADSLAEAWAHLDSGAYDLVLTDMRLPDGTGMELLLRLDELGRRERVVMITAYGSAQNAVEALKAGAYDYLTKPVDLKQFRAVVASSLGRVDAPATHAVPAAQATSPVHAVTDGPRRPPGLMRLVGGSRAMVEVRALVSKVARSMAPVLVQGESGTGKELVARAIHDTSARSARPFVAVNCGAIPESLLEAEFFGYRKGAFTGAQEDREGFFQAASGGTLFLDEIGDLPLAMQSKLLRAVQERAVRQVGAVTEQGVDVRLISATHKDLAEEVHQGRFRQDLYYRLNVIGISVPPLRERADDLPALCEAVLARIAREAGVEPPPHLTQGALLRLSQHRFPGNVRELENLLHRALALSGADEIGTTDLGLATGPEHAEDAPLAQPAPAVAAATDPDELPCDLVAHLDAVERDILERALDRHRFNRTAAGASLGLSLRQMRYRMARLGIDVGVESSAGTDRGGG